MLLQVTACCLSAYLVRWFELQQRLRYKAQLPPAVAAMQGHLYGLPPGLMVAQVGVGVWPGQARGSMRGVWWWWGVQA